MDKIRIDLKELIKAGVHFGHQRARWCPKMSPYIWGYSNDVHLINVATTASQLEKAAKFLEETAAAGKSILWVGTKKAAQDIIKSAAEKLVVEGEAGKEGNLKPDSYVIVRWIGGTLTNFLQVKKSITKMSYFEDIVSKSSDQTHYTKKELGLFQKMLNRLKENVGGIRKLHWPIGALVIVDIRKEQAALKEAVSMGIPVVAIVDTNCDPSLVDYVIPANDDAPKSIKIIIDYLAQAVRAGKQKAATATPTQSEMNSDATSEMTLNEVVFEATAEAEDETKHNKQRRVKEPVRRSDSLRRPDKKVR